RDVAEDAVQDALVRAFDRLADCREPDKFAGWLFLILRNRCYAERRRRQRQERPLDSTDEMFAAPDRPDGAYEQVERAHALERALQHLTPEQREVFVLKHMEGLAYEEIAGVTGATVASLKMRMRVRAWTVWAGALAAAAGLALLLVGRPASGPGPGSEARGGTRDSVFVRFVLYAPGARRVAVAGTFNQWDRSAAPLVPAGTS